MVKVAIVILNWNGRDDTLECLESIRSLTIINFQLLVVVVDNGSTDGSVPALAGFRFPAGFQYRLVETGENLGFAAGNNVGAKCALEDGADFVLVLNNDTVVNHDLVVQLIEAANIHKEAGVFSPKIYFAPGFEYHKDRYKKAELGRVIWYAGGKFDWRNVLGSNRGVDEVDRGQYNRVIKTDFATGACMFIRCEVLQAAGFFDGRYFLYLEDVEFSYRAKRHNWQVLYIPKAYLWHKVSQASQIGGQLHDYYITRNRLLFGTRYAPFRAKIALAREAVGFLLFGREWQRQAVADFFVGRLGRGSFVPK